MRKVGKTSLITRFMYDTFDHTYQVTEIKKKMMFNAPTENECHIIWIGNDRYRFLVQDYVSGRQNSTPTALGYCRSDRDSFVKTSKWIDDVRAERGNEAIVVLVGNKTDLNEKRQVTTEEGEKTAKELQVMFIETSAKAGHNVKLLFRRIAQALPGINSNPNDLKDSMQKINLSNSGSESSRCSC
ncbi:hypothetical protein EC973_007079 [Apophysomyces ossiformis]|uniref:Uncharacterized protein n=1 Tax=Apophysomyces ossiformis TaxID=679940 RepID=A0A8H7EUF8_9FUNG|nr:hypothetical protein EC973_007079 [Apophysomyces ossiformis]